MLASLRRNLVPSLLAAATLVATSVPAQALPLIGIGASGGAYGGYMTGAKTGLSFELDGNAQIFGLDAAGTVLGTLSGGGSLVEVGMRQELSFIPMISLKPMVGYQGNSLFGSSWDHAPVARLDVGFSPILSPIWFEGSVGASYPLALGSPVVSYLAGGYLAFLPIASVGLRYRGYDNLGNAAGKFNVLELGLRVSI